MTTRFGWCFSPAEDARIEHDACPFEVGAGGSILRCGCACHEGRIALNHGEIEAPMWDNLSAASTANEAARATAAKRSPGLTITSKE
jgi:hypothetical protein